MYFVDSLDINTSTEHDCMSPVLKFSGTALQTWQCDQIHDRIIFDFYIGLPHIIYYSCNYNIKIT